MPNTVISKTKQQVNRLVCKRVRRRNCNLLLKQHQHQNHTKQEQEQVSPAANMLVRNTNNDIMISRRQVTFGSVMLLLLTVCQCLAFVVASSSLDFPLGQSFISATASNSNNDRPQPHFDPSAYRNIYEAIRGHPDLREFANLCELDRVKEIVGMDKTPLTVFAPIDRSLADLLRKSKSRSINLVELTKHHITQVVVMPEENTKYPLKFSSYSLLSPLYLNQQQQSSPVYVNNAKILATHLIPIDSDQYQTLHVIDQALEFAYVNKRTQLPAQSSRRTSQRKRALTLEDVLQQGNNGEIYEFYERFADLHSSQPSADLLHTRAYLGSSNQQQRLQLSRDELNLEQLGRFVRQHAAQFKGTLSQADESSLNTYFLPVSNQELENLLRRDPNVALDTLQAHVIPNQVLFTRVMGLGGSGRSPAIYNADQRVSLSLAKTLPLVSGKESVESEEAASLALLSTPLLLQAESSQKPQQQQWRAGVTSAEILLANIPLSNGVLHLIRKPVLVTDSNNLLDYLNDNDSQLSQVVNAIGSRTSPASATKQQQQPVVSLNRFRELLAKERQMLSTFANMDSNGANKTILAPSDEAFARLRYDLRALVQGDEQNIPKHWDQSYRDQLLERLVKRHVILQQSITGEQIREQQPLQVLSENGKQLTFTATGNQDLQVECDTTQAKLLHHDLIGTNGVLHIIDRVLGEEEETVYSCLKSIVLRHRSGEDSTLSPGEELNQLIQSNLRNNREQDQISSTNSLAEQHGQQQLPELSLISKSIGQYLDELLAGSTQNKRQQLQQLASSVNISYQLAKLTSLAEGIDDWNERFKQQERQFTYFVPSDLAWIKLQQAQPELYKPLMYFLEQDSALMDNSAGVAAPAVKSPRSSESSHRLRQILERHLVVNRKLAKKDLNQLDSLQTLGATLRLVDAPAQQQLTATYTGLDGSLAASSSSIQPTSAFAALHSIGQEQSTSSMANKIIKSLRLDSSSANIVQASEASNGYVYVIDNVLVLPEDSEHILQTSQAPAVSSTMSSLLGAHNSAIIDFIQNLVSSPTNMSAQSILVLIGVLFVCISVLLVVALLLLARRRRLTKLNRHQQLESGLTSSSSANSGSTSTTKSL